MIHKQKVMAVLLLAGNICVGGWVLRGSDENPFLSGVSASQGSEPSTNPYGENIFSSILAMA